MQTPAQFWPTTGLDAMQYDASVAIGLDNLDDCLRGVACTVTDAPFSTTGSRQLTDTFYTVFSYSQSGAIAGMMKSDLVHQYDPVGDFPTNPLNALALVNALIGFAYEHPEGGFGTPELQGQ